MWRLIKLWLHDPPQWRPVVLFGYAIAFAMGVVTLWWPPVTISGQLGDVLTQVWAWALITGSALAASMVYTDRWLLERLGIKIAGLGLVMYLVIVVYLWGAEAGNRGTQFFGLILGATFLLLRHLQIGAWDYAPEATDQED